MLNADVLSFLFFLTVGSAHFLSRCLSCISRFICLITSNNFHSIRDDIFKNKYFGLIFKCAGGHITSLMTAVQTYDSYDIIPTSL